MPKDQKMHTYIIEQVIWMMQSDDELSCVQHFVSRVMRGCSFDGTYRKQPPWQKTTSSLLSEGWKSRYRTKSRSKPSNDSWLVPKNTGGKPDKIGKPKFEFSFLETDNRSGYRPVTGKTGKQRKWVISNCRVFNLVTILQEFNEIAIAKNRENFDSFILWRSSLLPTT